MLKLQVLKQSLLLIQKIRKNYHTSLELIVLLQMEKGYWKTEEVPT
jgi:hypothetical protein